MLRLLRRTVCAGLASLALGVMPPALFAYPKLPVASAPSSTAEQQAGRIELALMSDSRTFTLALEARAEGESVVLTGQVPDEPARQHVLKTARQSSFVSVIDRLTVEQKPAAVSDETAALRLAAIALVRAKLGHRANGVKVLASEEGTVELHGKVGSMQERLEASRCLRGLPGCTRVENYLDAAGEKDGGETSRAQPAQEAKHVVPASALAAPPARPADLLPAPKEVPPNPTFAPTGPGAAVLPATAPAQMPVYVPSTTYVHVPTRVVPSEPGPRPVVQPLVVGYVQPSPAQVPYTGCVVTGQGVQLNVAQHIGPPTFMDRFRLALGLKPKCACAGAPATAYTAAPPLAQMPTQPVVRPVVLPGDATGAPGGGVLYIPKTEQRAPVSSGPQAAPVSVAPWPPAHRTEERGGPRTAVPITPPVLPPSSTGQPLPVSAPPRVEFASSGTTAPISPPHPATARQMVLNHCGDLALKVEASLSHDNALMLHVYAAPGAEHALKARLTQLFSRYDGMHIRIHLAQ